MTNLSRPNKISSDKVSLEIYHSTAFILQKTGIEEI
jgi:hypothetical protein